METENKTTNRVLVLVDCQVDFISGSLANKDAQACIPAIVEKIKNFNGDAILLTMDTHFDNYLDTPEGKKLPVKHCIYGTDGWKINEDVLNAVQEKELLGMHIEYVMKPTFGSIESMRINTEDGDVVTNSLVESILDMEREYDKPVPMEIECCGFCTEICLASNVLILKAFTYDFAEITVDSKCCAGVTPEKHEAALEVMKSCQINVI